MSSCSNLVFLTTLACQLSECLTEAELALLSANLTVLSDMLSAIAAQEEFCQSRDQENKTNTLAL